MSSQERATLLTSNLLTPSLLTPSLLEEWARDAGFDRAGVATLEPFGEQGGAFLRWLERGEHAGMGYLAERVEERLEPAKVLEGARAALCVALQYSPLQGEAPTAAAPDNDLWPKVARYAHGRDYHNLMGKRLKKLAKRIRQAFPGCDTRIYVDTGPVLERALAARAGIGVTGKNTCLLSRQGSWFLLGEIFLTLEVEPNAEMEPQSVSEPLTDLCGRCTRCLDACPTDALREPYRLDANRCISYWTIEHRGAIPPEWRDKLDGWVFGCDICQDVCPWNIRDSPAADHPDLHLAPQRADLDLIQLLRLDEHEYKERFRGSAMQRARLDGLQRNATLAMAHRSQKGSQEGSQGGGEERYVPALAEALASNPSPVVRGHAAWALGRLGSDAARRVLDEALASDKDPTVLEEVRGAKNYLDG